jgi:hypothetical protein
MKLKFSRYIFNSPQISNFMKIPLVVDEFFLADRRTDLQAHFLNFSNAQNEINWALITAVTCYIQQLVGTRLKSSYVSSK